MKALVIGQGGREHALVKALRASPSVSEVHAAPGSDGIALDAKCHPISWQRFDLISELINRESIDLVVVGPELPLVEGLTDHLRAQGVAVIGPSREAARLEGSKIFCKQFLLEAGIPTARSFVVSTVEEAREAARAFQPPYVLKADGLAAGKGVFVCATLEELLEAARMIFVERSLGQAGERALLEEFSPGYEISYIVLTNGESFEALPFAQDHKRLKDDDQGPNTGGMGVVAPILLDAELKARIDREVLEPTMRLMKTRKLVYRGALFVGLMITPQGPSVLEFNTRFGDPETQAILPLLDGDWGQVFSELAAGRISPLRWLDRSACCVVLAAEGYPDASVKDVVIQGCDEIKDASGAAYLIHAGTSRDSRGRWLTYGGRVLCVVGLGPHLSEARDRAYQLADRVRWPGMQLRKDIGAGALRLRM